MVSPATTQRNRRASIKSSERPSRLHKLMAQAIASVTRRAGKGTSMDESDRLDHRPWPLRGLLLLLLGALLGLAIHFLTRGPEVWKWTENPPRLGAAAALAAGGIVFAFSLERLRPLWSLA